jgi:two-component system, cell cycle sensor histidine kinase and response regulator CckA
MNPTSARASDRKSAATLQASVEDVRALVEAMPHIVWIARADGSNVYWNQQWMDYTGLTLEESLGHGWSAPFHPDDRPRALEDWQQALATLRTYSVECRLRRADGIYRWWLIRAVPQQDAEGKVLRWCGTCTDIDDLKLAHLEIVAADLRFAKVFHSGLVAISIVELRSGRMVDVNDRYAALFGYAREEMIGRTVFELELWADAADRDRVIAGIATGVSAAHTEAAFRRKSGEIRHALVSMEATTVAGTAEALAIVVLVDMTEHKQLEEQLLQSQKMEAVGRLAGGIAHDFNNGLSVILGYTELLLRRASEAQRGKLEQILKATERASGLTHQLLAFSRKELVHPKILDLNALLLDLEKMLCRLIGEDVDLAIVPGAFLGQVKADPGQLQQVVVNLCVNARDAMPGGGLLRLETANADLDAGHSMRHEVLAAGRYVMLAVNDTGSGIAKEILTKIFDPFFTTKEQGKGTGLGLAMVYGIVKQAGGYVWVYSEVGQGTTVKIFLPRIDELLSTEARDLPMPPRGWETVLLVEDEEPLRTLAREILAEHGYEVIEAAGGDEAIALARGHLEPIHLLVTDVVMPGMNGRVLAETLAAARPGLRVLYMSGYTDDIMAHSGVLETGTLLLQKPFTALSLLRRVSETLADES